ncbi:hypothetical protein ACWAUC_25485 [Bradyrhizobium guangdongense]
MIDKGFSSRTGFGPPRSGKVDTSGKTPARCHHGGDAHDGATTFPVFTLFHPMPLRHAVDKFIQQNARAYTSRFSIAKNRASIRQNFGEDPAA